MTTSAHPRSRRPRAVATILASTLVAGSLALGVGGAQPAGAADPPEHREVRLCDATACLFAWHVVDSDGDGVSDADELLAGTNPHDAASSPPLQHLGELALQRELPSFEAGLSAFVLLPPGIHTVAEALTKDPLQAFPMGKRRSALELLGVSDEKLGAAGIDPMRHGLTIGLDHPSKDGGRPPVRVGGIDTRLISAAPDFSKGIEVHSGAEWQKKHGGLTSWERKGENQIVQRYADGARVIATFDEQGWKKTETYNEKGKLESTATRIDPEPEGPPVSSNEPTPGDDGVVPGEEPDDGDPHDPDDDNPNGYIVYVNPDADSTEVTPEQVDLVLRTLGSTVLTVQVEGPDTDPATLKRPGTTILVDPEQAGTYAIVLDAPKVTTAQPEYGNRRPSPIEAAPLTGGDCKGLC